jgi:DNA-binding HxlR family transcriptional regulator/putative sterol carrier protein
MGAVTNRTYGDGCGVAHALDLIGERWALLIVRDLVLGPKRFTDLQAGLSGASPNVLSQRLRELETAGVVRRRTLAPPAASKIYELTDWGSELAPIVAQLGRWGSRSPVIPPNGPVGTDSLMLSIRNFFNPRGMDHWTATYEIRLGDEQFQARVVDGRLVDVRRGQPERPDATVETDIDTLNRLLAGEESRTHATRDGRLVLTGDTAAARRFLDAARF